VDKINAQGCETDTGTVKTQGPVRCLAPASEKSKKSGQLEDKGQITEGEEYRWDTGQGQGVSCGGKRMSTSRCVATSNRTGSLL